MYEGSFSEKKARQSEKSHRALKPNSLLTEGKADRAHAQRRVHAVTHARMTHIRKEVPGEAATHTCVSFESKRASSCLLGIWFLAVFRWFPSPSNCIRIKRANSVRWVPIQDDSARPYRPQSSSWMWLEHSLRSPSTHFFTLLCYRYWVSKLPVHKSLSQKLGNSLQ